MLSRPIRSLSRFRISEQRREKRKRKTSHSSFRQAKMSIREVVRNLHSAIIAKDWEGVRNLYHKDFERYVFGSFHPDLIPNHEGVTGGLEFLFEHGTFIKFDFRSASWPSSPLAAHLTKIAPVNQSEERPRERRSLESTGSMFPMEASSSLEQPCSPTFASMRLA